MKIFIGILSVLIVLGIGVLGVMAIWGIYPVSWEIIWKSAVSIVVTSITLTVFWLVVTLFLKEEMHHEDGNKAHRIN